LLKRAKMRVAWENTGQGRDHPGSRALAHRRRGGGGKRIHQGRGAPGWGGDSGGKERLGRISRAGKATFRTVLVLGATANLRSARRRPDAADWTRRLLARRPFKVAAVALANKMARIAWALLVKGGVCKSPVAA
jgi:transposase